MNRITPGFLTLCFSLFMLAMSACDNTEIPEPEPPQPKDTLATVEEFLIGADFSYINEMVDCGAVYKDSLGQATAPLEIFSRAGCQWARYRLWHSPNWTAYSNFEDVRKSIQSAKDQGMKVLLDFHYSDDWADPGSQEVPAAWLGVVNDVNLLGDSVYNYTYRVLAMLHRDGLLPEMVQVGNETNSEILQDPNGTYSRINWTRNARLLNRGVDAIRTFSEDKGEAVEIMLHIAQPENALWWFEEAADAGLTDFDWIGVSYYPAWSDYSLNQLPGAIERLITDHKKNVIIVETAYPFTMDNQDAANNILGQDALVAGYPATPKGQFEFLKALKDKIEEGGGAGMFYWEPAWVSTGCGTRWGQGSHWDNAVFFDKDGLPNQAMGIFRY